MCVGWWERFSELLGILLAVCIPFFKQRLTSLSSGKDDIPSPVSSWTALFNGYKEFASNVEKLTLLKGHLSVVNLLISILCLYSRGIYFKGYFDSVLKINCKKTHFQPASLNN